LKELAKKYGFEIIQETFQPVWQCVLKQGEFVLILEHRNDDEFYYVFHTLKITDEDTLMIFDKIKDDPQFIFGIRSALSSPFTQYSVIIENGRFLGFNIVKKIFPESQNFTLENFDSAILAIGNVAGLGITYLSSFVTKNNSVKQGIVEDKVKTPSDMMFH